MVERGRRDSDITVTFSPVDVESQDTLDRVGILDEWARTTV
jgi:hypothetical protein